MSRIKFQRRMIILLLFQKQWKWRSSEGIIRGEGKQKETKTFLLVTNCYAERLFNCLWKSRLNLLHRLHVLYSVPSCRFNFQIFLVLNCSLCCYFKVILMVQFSLFNHISFIIFSHHKKSITQHNVTNISHITFSLKRFQVNHMCHWYHKALLMKQGMEIVPLSLSVMVEPWPDLWWHAGEMHSSGMWKVFQWKQ